jgi:hypothetical protein
MWVKKSAMEQALSEAKNAKEKFRNAAIFSIALVMLITVGYTFTYSRMDSIKHGGLFLIPRGEIPAHFFPALILGIIMGAGTYLLIMYPKKPSKLTFICPRCEAAKDDAGNLTCSCGGHFEDIKTMKWVEVTKVS